MIDEQLITRDPQIMSGTPVFARTRVPIQNLFDYIEGDETLEEFLDDFPGAKREQASAVLELYKKLLPEEAV